MELLWLVPALPLLGFALLTLARRLVRGVAALIGVGSIGLSMLVTLWIAYSFLVSPPQSGAASDTVWSWIALGDFRVSVAFYLDSFSLVMILVITIVGFFIHLYSAGYMEGDDGFARFFAYMNLFTASMLILVLADNLLLLLVGWEGVGLCSYLLIGFWYRDPANARAAVKAFVVTRTGDAAMLVGFLLLFTSLGTLNIQDLLSKAVSQWPSGSGIAIAAAALILAGALGKSAQLPLQTWLPDAMAGPTPVSALIHAATMVTAGVYLVARTHAIFALAPPVQLAVGIIGVATLLIAGFSAITQRDIKRVLAYSTMSQIGYMFLALGVGAWGAALFHFVTHAFFKSLLFLAAGSVILAMHHEQDLLKMGGLWKRAPVAFWTFLVGALAMAAVPPLISGFSSKDWILSWVWSSPAGGPVLYVLALLGVLLTATYTARLVTLAFFGRERDVPEHVHPGGALIAVPLIVLAVPALFLGLIQTPRSLGGVNLFASFVQGVLPEPGAEGPPSTELLLMAVSTLVALAGLVLGWALGVSQARAHLARREAEPAGSPLHRFLLSGWGFDWLYDRAIVGPYRWLARINQSDVADWIARGFAALSRLLNRLLSLAQTGRLRWYATALGIGAVAIVAMVVFL